MKNPAFDAVYESHKAAILAYKADLEQLSALGTRLCDQYTAKLSFTKTPGKKKAAKIIAECKTIRAQLDKVGTPVKEAKQRYLAKVDECNESVVQQFKGLLAYAIGTGSASAGLRYLYDTCLDFDRAKGNFELRQACYDSFQSLTGPVTESLAPAETPVSTILTDYESISDPEAKSFFFKNHRDAILAAHDRQIAK